MSEQTKQCSKCKEILPLTEFFKQKRSKGGLLPSCKKCQTEIMLRGKRRIQQLTSPDVSKSMLVNIEDIPGFHKKVRMSRYDALFTMAFKKGNLQSAKQVLDSMREEVEGKGKQVIIGNASFTRISKMSDEELVREKDRILKKLDKLKRVTPQGGGENAE